MIHDLDETLKEILVKRGKLNSGDIDIAFDQPTGEWAAGLSRPTINVYLYDIRENMELRNPSMRSVHRGNGKARVVFAPRRIDISYLITVWARNPEDEHQLLWRVLRTLSGITNIRPDEGAGMVRDQPLDMPVKVALPSDAVRNMPDLWGVMENQLKPSINLQVTVALDDKEAIEAPLVLTAIYRISQADPPRQKIIAEDISIYHIGGQVLVKDIPVGAGAQVTLLDRGETVETDPDGRYVFAYMTPGEYDVEVSVEGRQPKRYTITIPNDNNYDLSL